MGGDGARHVTSHTQGGAVANTTVVDAEKEKDGEGGDTRGDTLEDTIEMVGDTSVTVCMLVCMSVLIHWHWP